MTSRQLLATASGVLEEEHRRQLEAVVDGRLADVHEPATRRYVDAETQLRNALASTRAAHAGVEATPWLRPHDEYDRRTEQAAATAMSVTSPVERELVLDRHRWALLDELAALPAFGPQAILAYAFKLAIVEKWSALSDEEGMQRARAIVEQAAARIRA